MVAVAVVFGSTADAGRREEEATRLDAGGPAIRRTVAVREEREFYFDVRTSGADVVVELRRETGIPIVYLEKGDASTSWSLSLIHI